MAKTKKKQKKVKPSIKTEVDKNFVYIGKQILDVSDSTRKSYYRADVKNLYDNRYRVTIPPAPTLPSGASQSLSFFVHTDQNGKITYINPPLVVKEST